MRESVNELEWESVESLGALRVPCEDGAGGQA